MSLTPGSGVGTLPFSVASSGAASGPGANLILWTDSEKVTPFSPYTLEQMTRIDTIFKHASKVVERLRCSAQPNPEYRADRLVPSDVNKISERLHFVMALRDAIICFDNAKPLSEYATELSAAEEEIERLHDTYLRRVVLFGVKPIRKFLDETYPAIKKAHAELIKAREKYDGIRSKLGKSDNAELLSKMKVIQSEFSDKAAFLSGLFREMPVHQMAISKAVDDCARSEADFCNQAIRIVETVKPPDSKARWAS